MTSRSGYPSDLSDARWALFEPTLSAWRQARLQARRDAGFDVADPDTDLREVMDAILYVNRTGIPWRYLPRDFPPYQTVYTYFSAWTKGRIFEALGLKLTALARAKAGRVPTPTAAVVDTQSVKTSANVPLSSQGTDAGKKIVGRKRGIATDVLGLVLAVVVTAASLSDNAVGARLLDQAKQAHPTISKAWADAGFKNTFIEHGAALGINVEIVPRKSQTPGFHVVKRRWVVERTLCAARRSVVFPENREGLEGRFLGRAANLDPKGEGDKSMLVCPVAGSRCQGRRTGRTRAIWRKLDCLNPNLQSMQVPIHRKGIRNRCRVLCRSRWWPMHPSECEATPSEGVEGDEWGAYVALLRTTETNAGSSVGRKPYGDGGLVVVAGVTTGQGGRESRPQGEGGQVIGHPRLGRYA